MDFEKRKISFKNTRRTIKYIANADVDNFVPINGETYICNLGDTLLYKIIDDDLDEKYNLKEDEAITFKTITVGSNIIIWEDRSLTTLPHTEQTWYILKRASKYILMGG